jgi:hypothetical protein
MKKNGLFILLLFVVFHAQAQETSYNYMQVSLLTVKPRPNAVYTIYGHTALRLYDPSQNIDAVLNWGTFNFNEPNFLYRFVKGETDYFLSATTYDRFFADYSEGNATVIEQVLNIPDENKQELLEKLSFELLPENCEYRYNFLFDNCTTRPRDVIEQFCGWKLIYPPSQTSPTTFRQLIHSCTQPYPWMTFGIDLVIGSGADSLLTDREELFLPEKLMTALEYSRIATLLEEELPLVVSTEIVLQPLHPEIAHPKIWDSPLIIGIVLFCIYLALAITGYRKKRKFRIPFALLFLAAGLAGCIVTFLSFFSDHPCTQYNWNLLWLHPIHLLGVIGFFFPLQDAISPDKKNKIFSKETIKFAMTGLFCWFHRSNLVLLSFLLLAIYRIPQQLNPAIIPYILCLWIISGYWLLQLKKKNA